MTELIRGAELLDRLLCLARRIGFGDGAPAQVRMADLAEFAAVHHEVMDRIRIGFAASRGIGAAPADAARLVNEIRRLTEERDEARASLIRITVMVQTVLADAESRHPGGSRPDVTTVAALKEALRSAP